MDSVMMDYRSPWTGLRILCVAFPALLMAMPAMAAEIYSVFYDDRFGTINDTTGVFKEISTLPVAESAGIAYDNGELYAQGTNGALVTINPVSGASSIVGYSGLNLTSEVFAGGNDGLYEIDSLSNVYDINPATGAAVLVGATGLPPNYGSWDTSLSDSGTNLYFTAGGPGQNDELYRINTQTGVATDLGSTGVTGIAGSAIVNGNLELFQYHWSGATDYIYSATLGSTNFTSIGVLGAQPVDGGTLLGLSPAVFSSVDVSGSPEPAAFILVGSGLAGFALFRGRRQRCQSNRDRAI